MTECSYNGWPASKDPHAIGVVHLDLPGHPNAFPPGVKGGDVAIVLGYVATMLHKRVEPLGEGCWGYSYRKNRNANNLSCHASGTAIDYNAPKHPNGKHGTWTAAQIAEVRKILAEVGGVVKWGEDFHGTVDGMHFEIHGSGDQVHAVAVRLTQSPVKPAPAKATAKWRDLKRGDTGHVVDVIANRLKVGGHVYSNELVHAVRVFQNAHHLPVTGVVDETTYREIMR